VNQQDIELLMESSGYKKDIILSNKIYTHEKSSERVVIYGWHRAKDDPIQAVYNGHNSMYVDYSHAVRLISNSALLNGKTIQIAAILKDTDLSTILSDKGVISRPYYLGNSISTSLKK